MRYTTYCRRAHSGSATPSTKRFSGKTKSDLSPGWREGGKNAIFQTLVSDVNSERIGVLFELTRQFLLRFVEMEREPEAVLENWTSLPAADYQINCVIVDYVAQIRYVSLKTASESMRNLVRKKYFEKITLRPTITRHKKYEQPDAVLSTARAKWHATHSIWQ